jgi:AraC-like DNA-binding protein
MKPIPLTRCAFLLPFNEVLTEIGAPTSSLLARQHLPTSLEEKANDYVPILPAIRFAVHAQASQGIPDIAFRAGRRLRYGDLSEQMRASIDHSPTLFAALQRVCALASFEDTNLRAWLERGQHSLRVCTVLHGTGGMLHLEHSQWIQNLMVIYIVRQFAGPNWAPATIAFEARYIPSAETQSLWPNTRFLSGQTASWIDVPILQLALPNLSNRTAHGLPQAGSPPIATDVITAFKLMLSSYVDERLPNVREAAEIAGTSVRSLQRELAKFNFTYSDLLDQVRFEKAAKLLCSTGAKIIDVAIATGYADPAHFARAFRRVTGVSPREFREERVDARALPNADGRTDARQT